MANPLGARQVLEPLNKKSKVATSGHRVEWRIAVLARAVLALKDNLSAQLGAARVAALQECVSLANAAPVQVLFTMLALGRIGGRVPLYGPLNAVVPVKSVNVWLEAVLAYEWPNAEKAAFPMAQLGRKTGDRGRDIDDEIRATLAKRLRTVAGGERTARLVEEVVELEAREERVALGDSLPAGLRLLHDQD